MYSVLKYQCTAPGKTNEIHLEVFYWRLFTVSSIISCSAYENMIWQVNLNYSILKFWKITEILLLWTPNYLSSSYFSNHSDRNMKHNRVKLNTCIMDANEYASCNSVDMADDLSPERENKRHPIYRWRSRVLFSCESAQLMRQAIPSTSLAN